MIKNDGLSIVSFLVIYMYRDRVQGLLKYITYVIELLKQFNISCDRVFDIIDDKKIKKETFWYITFEKFIREFEFKNVYFSYDKEKDVLKDINFKINSHEIISFVGKSGSGKSTILN